MASTPFNLPSSGAIVANPGSSVTWANPSAITADDGSSASTSYVTPGQYSTYLYASGFGFNIPDDQSITGFSVYLDMIFSGSTPTLGLTINGTSTVGTPVGGAFWSQSLTQGGVNFNWGVNFSKAEVEDTLFGCLIFLGGAPASCSIDAVKMAVLLTDGPAAPVHLGWR